MGAKPVGAMIIQAILFDFGQTLVDSSNGFRLAEKQAEIKIFAELGLESWAAFLANYRRVRRNYHERSAFSRQAIWQAIYAHYDQQPRPGFLAEAERSYWRTVQSKTTIFPEAIGVLKELSYSYKLAMITNTQGSGSTADHRIARFPELQTFFETTIIAGDGDIPAKPNAEPFLRCTRALGIEPHEAVYVGDDWRIDICGARAAGIHPIWLQHQSVSRKWPEVETSVPVITSLEQLLNLGTKGGIIL